MEFEDEIISVLRDSSICVLCLAVKDEMLVITDDPELDIVTALCQHFWFSSVNILDQSVCKSCWKRVEEFHRFYQQVELLYTPVVGIRIAGIGNQDDNVTEEMGAPEYIEEETEQACAPLDAPINNHEQLEELIDVDDSISSKENELMAEVDEDDLIISKHTQLKCSHCSYSTSTFVKLMEHIRSIHTTTSYVECCGQKFYKRSRLLDHVIKLENYVLDKRKFENFVCSVCQKTFLSDRILKAHITKAHGPGKIICEKCPQHFKTLAQLRGHQKAEHSSNQDKRKQCKLCKRWLKNAASLRKHTYRHQSSSKPNICDICGKNAPNALALRSHMSFVHQKEKTFGCTICKKAFRRAFELKEHLATHTGNTLYHCVHCSKPFNSSANMHAHKKRVHPKEWEQSRREYERKYE